MTLTPKLPPGRANRKALAFTGDIHRLREAGYTFSAIHAALIEAGIAVSLSTVKREAARHRTEFVRTSGLTEHGHGPAPGPTPASIAVAHAPIAPMTGNASGREIAAAFFDAHPSNPLFAPKDSP